MFFMQNEMQIESEKLCGVIGPLLDKKILDDDTVFNMCFVNENSKIKGKQFVKKLNMHYGVREIKGIKSNSSYPGDLSLCGSSMGAEEKKLVDDIKDNDLKNLIDELGKKSETFNANIKALKNARLLIFLTSKVETCKAEFKELFELSNSVFKRQLELGLIDPLDEPADEKPSLFEDNGRVSSAIRQSSSAPVGLIFHDARDSILTKCQ